MYKFLLIGALCNLIPYTYYRALTTTLVCFCLSLLWDSFTQDFILQTLHNTKATMDILHKKKNKNRMR